MSQNKNINEENMQMEVEVISINDINPSIYNPRKITRSELEKLKSSIKTFGLTDPLIINLKNQNTLIGGHQRHKALKEIMRERGQNDMPMILLKRGDIGFVFTQEMLNVKDVTHEKALNIALNKISGDWNKYKLNYLLMDIESSGLSLNLTGFDTIDISLEDVESTSNKLYSVSEKAQKRLKASKAAKEQDDINDKWEFKLPTYTPKRPKEKILVSDLYTLPEEDYSKYIERIKNEEMKKLLYMRVAWFTIFNFEKIANYYTFQATEDERLIFEKLALVTLDKDKLIEHGFMKAGKDLEAFKDEFKV